MFELVSEDTIRYKGDGIEQWKEEYVANIRKKAEAITVENMLEWNSTYYLKQAIENPLDTAYHFYLDGEGCQSFAEPSFEFMQFVCSIEPGTLLYIGGVIDYHSDGKFHRTTCVTAGGFSFLVLECQDYFYSHIYLTGHYHLYRQISNFKASYPLSASCIHHRFVSCAKVRWTNAAQGALTLPSKNLTTAFRNHRLRYFIKFHHRFFALCSCFHRLKCT